MKINLKYTLIFVLSLWATLSFAVTSSPILHDPDSTGTPKDWFNLDPDDDGVMGTASDKAHELLLKNKTPKKTVVVAVIDSGVDIQHEDLQGKIWTNTKEIPGNGIDDDGNGYVDDVHGWNFIGGSDGSHVADDSYELTREFVKLKSKYENADPDKIKRRQRDEFAYWQKIREEFESTKEEAVMNYELTSKLQENFNMAADFLKEAMDKEDFNKEDLVTLETEDSRVQNTSMMLQEIFNNFGEDTNINEILFNLDEAVEHFEKQVNYAYNTDFDPRHIVGDDPENYKDRDYGNNDPVGPDAKHGTHVAGIIAADRNNDLGIRGIAEHVLIMPVRAVPNGDERDKDIANAIYYAVDNGADIINMSFGKSYSPGKSHVDKAVKYAEKKGVLLIHAAGNEGKEVDPSNNYPNRWFSKRGEASNWVEVGANSWEANENLPASFSNYSNEGVDLFAPGVDLYSTVPGSEYESNSGTSMAAPTVSGVAALIIAYYPELKPKEIRSILQQSVYKKADRTVIKPGDDEKVSFGSLSITGGLVNAYQALQMAEQLSSK